MRRRIPWTWAVLVATIVVVSIVIGVMPSSSLPVAKRKAVVIELFTSEGCSSCPPADALLTRLGHGKSSNGAEVIPLGFHVDYWNYLGWQDRFSSHAFSERQEKYAARFNEGPYTPQLVVDGESQLVGSDSAGAENAIVQAASRLQESDVELSWESPDKLLVVATAKENAPSAQVLMAITEDSLASNVAAGENGGHVLHHSAVVRDLRLLGQLSHGRLQIEVPIKSAKDWKPQDLRLVVFLQGAPVGPIIGAASIPFPK